MPPDRASLPGHPGLEQSRDDGERRGDGRVCAGPVRPAVRRAAGGLDRRRGRGGVRARGRPRPAAPHAILPPFRSDQRHVGFRGDGAAHSSGGPDRRLARAKRDDAARCRPAADGPGMGRALRLAVEAFRAPGGRVRGPLRNRARAAMRPGLRRPSGGRPIGPRGGAGVRRRGGRVRLGVGSSRGVERHPPRGAKLAALLHRQPDALPHGPGRRSRAGRRLSTPGAADQADPVGRFHRRPGPHRGVLSMGAALSRGDPAKHARAAQEARGPDEREDSRIRRQRWAITSRIWSYGTPPPRCSKTGFRRSAPSSRIAAATR